MAQNAKVIDVTRSYVPGDPNVFPQNLSYTAQEDAPEKDAPILPYEGYNFLPTSYGYRSYFGTNSELQIGALSSRTQFILSYQLPNYKTFLIALCEDGIWIVDANIANSTWQHVVTFNLNTPAPFYQTDVFEEWTWCVIENVLYMYQQGRSSAWKTSYNGTTLVIQTHTPTFLNMAGQMGIFKAGTRLGFWDSANSVSWSSNLDLTDFTPSIENMAGSAIYGDVVGRIVTVKSHGEGFIIYSTKSVTGITLDVTGNLLWDAKKIFDNVGISHGRAVTFGQSDNEHFVYGTNGIYKLGSFNALEGSFKTEVIVPELYDLLRESRSPVYMDCLNSRWLIFGLFDAAYIYGKASFVYINVDPQQVVMTLGEGYWSGDISLLPETLDGNSISTAIAQHTNGNVDRIVFSTSSAKFYVPRWRCYIDKMDKELLTSMDENIWEAPGMVSPYEVPTDSYTQPKYPSGTPICLTSAQISALSADAGNPLYDSAKVGNTYLIQGLRPDMWYEDAAFSINLAGLIDAQLKEWDDFKYRQTQTLSNLLAMEDIENTESYTDGQEVGRFLNGVGHVKCILRNNELVLRKYFKQENVISWNMPPDPTYPTIGAFESNWNAELPAYTPLPGMMAAAQAIYDGSTILTVADFMSIMNSLFLDAFGTAGNFVLLRVYSTGPVTEIYNTTSYASALAEAQAWDSANAPSDFISSGSQRYFAVGYKTGIPSYGDYEAYIEWSYSFGNIASSFGIEGPANLTHYSSWDIGNSIGEYTNAVNTLPTPHRYSELRANLTHLDLVSRNIGGGYTLYKELPQTLRARTAYDNSYPDYAARGLSITQAEDIIFLEDNSGNQTAGRNPFNIKAGTFREVEQAETSATAPDPTVVSLPGYELEGSYHPPAEFSITYPGANFLLQTGALALSYEQLLGFLSYDLQLKKWGKFRGSYTALVDFNAINVAANSEIIDFSDEGISAGVFPGDYIYAFDSLPGEDESLIRYGKIGFSRLGMTNLLEVRLHFRKLCDCVVEIQGSMDGESLDPSVIHTETVATVREKIIYLDLSARWFSIKISGNFDLTGLEFRGKVAGRR